MAPLNSTKLDEDQVLVEEKSFARILTLNRPRQLNALSFQMISRLLELFLANERDPNVKLVIVKGKGRAFCAGGDVAAVVHLVNEGNWRLGAKFFSKEFILNYIMATYRKNQVSILNGIVMGGGAGASIHGRFRVATENSLFAMPETALGLFPDVGASYFLSRLPGFFGEYVGLTGTRLDGAEMLACGLATHFVPSARLSLLEEALCKLDSTDPALISAIIDEYSHQPSLKEQSAYHRLSVIDRCFSRRTVEEILSALEREVLNKKDDWISATIQSLKAASPMSLKISLRSIRQGRGMSRVTPILRKGRKVLQDLDLFKVLQSEIAHEHSSDRFQNNQSGPVRDFCVEYDSSQSQDVVLRKKCESGEEVAVSALLGPVTYGRQSSMFPREIVMKVCLKKPGLRSILQFDCGVSPRGDYGSEFDIHNAYYIQSSTQLGPSVYRGTEFSRLDPQLQDALKEYLVSKGIGENLTNFLLLHLHKKEQVQYVNWLQKLESLVAESN